MKNYYMSSHYLIKKTPPKVIDEDFLKKLKDTNIPNKQIKLKKCKTKGVYKCDVSIEKINSMISTFIKVAKKKGLEFK